MELLDAPSTAHLVGKLDRSLEWNLFAQGGADRHDLVPL